MLELDGSIGEGGGQILRSALALALVTGTAFKINRIRANRPRPGLARQHLTAVRAAEAVGGAKVVGAELGSRELVFRPGALQPGEYVFDVGSAGSVTLVLQTVLVPLLTASGPSTLILRGGTHNPKAPPFDFLDRVFLPLINRMGPVVAAKLDRHGFYPTGGGKIRVSIKPTAVLAPIELGAEGEARSLRACALVAGLPVHIAERELKVLRRRLALAARDLEIVELDPGRGPGNAVTVTVEGEHTSELFTGFGEKGVRAEILAERLADRVERFLAADVPVGEHLADQLLVPMAVGGGGTFVTTEPTPHLTTNAEVIRSFLPVRLVIDPAEVGAWRVTVGGAPGRA